MIKLIVYIVVIVNFVGLVNCGADKCTPYKCQGLYRDCGKPGQICSEGLYCNTGDSTPVCYSRVEEFNGCTSNIQCKKGTVCVTKHYDRYCKEIGFKGYGEECYLPEECSTGLDCMNNTCDHTPQMCTTYSCPYGKFCSQKKVCTPLITDGDECDPLEPHCYPGSICSGGFNDTICRPAYSRSEGDPCNNDISCDIGKGLGCKNGICTKYKPHVDSNKVYCLDDTVCFIGIEKCICNNSEIMSDPALSTMCTNSQQLAIAHRSAIITDTTFIESTTIVIITINILI
ncbi:hypothetical protein PPL_02759 [Heterostelium album PN500]|uniref:Uncharacterized protein n=1 Tax=Heterostelium pallidum (strain ATCC 26659 / Pp 5 / PN500) TaxID=670386 RepID=D3B2Z4_HETP5|nr:hypothetical protein PPL_02759 [Heterostelium album PN500]EFA83692.1 hypothetical protein PPL_02759 [Heterostelium album PN500]|eukprot:XP_020435809.1 hypothetical protein PPL_02759 [Heterostelium album PN500]